MIAEAVTGWGACGIKVPWDDARITEGVRAGATRPLPVMGEPSTIELVAAEYPRVTFIIPHLGSFADDWQAQRVMIDVLARHPNVYTVTSGVRRFDLLLEAVCGLARKVSSAPTARGSIRGSSCRRSWPSVYPLTSGTWCLLGTGCGSRLRPGRGPGPGFAPPGPRPRR